MNIKTRIALSIASAVAGLALDGLLVPPAYLATNPALVGQMANSDKASVLASYLGHGPQWLEISIWLGVIALLAAIWLRRSR
ncbi:hypothetical protein [Chitinimonas sp.]|uniref:hypothetical protein n=1 Tax=Chitinimonas sp. TaxID=1934313 RepID=UPI0035AF7976